MEWMEKTVLITGATGGLGKAFARRFAELGWALVLSARGEQALEALREELLPVSRVPITVIAQDLAAEGAARALFDETFARGLTVDALVNNAGFGDFGAFHEQSRTKLDEMVLVNVLALTQLTRLFLPGMVERGHGYILNVASTAAFQPGPLMAVYYASKAFALSFSEALARELKGTGVTVTALCPGPTSTGFVAAAHLERSGLFKNLPVGAPGPVARRGVDAMLDGRVVAFYGALNRFMAFGVRFQPRALTSSLIYNIQKTKL